MQELLARGVPTDQILVIDQKEERVRLAGSMGVAAFQADAAQEDVLKEGCDSQGEGGHHHGWA